MDKTKCEQQETVEKRQDPFAGNRTAAGQLAPGHSGGPGRPKGTPDRSRTFRERLWAAIDALDRDVVQEIVEQDPKLALKLAAQLEPREHGVKVQTQQVCMVVYPATPPEGWTPPRIDGGVAPALPDDSG